MRTSVGSVVATLAVVAVTIFGTRAYDTMCRPFTKNPHLFVQDITKLAPGYILAPQYALKDNNAEKGTVNLLDVNGNVVHTWTTKYQPLDAMLKKNGNIVVSMTLPAKVDEMPAPGTTGLLQELDWEGNVVWEYEDKLMNHAFDVFPDGAIAYSKWSEATSTFVQNIRGGNRTATTSIVWVNDVEVINPQKQITWSWKLQDHVVPERYWLGLYIPLSDWAHINSVRYVTSNPITHTPAYLVSVRNVSRVMLVGEGSGEIIWESPPGMFSNQHDATLLRNGNILVFDNGFLNGSATINTRIIEVNPMTNEIAWQYNGGSGGGPLFATIIAGGVQRLDNGNTLITLSTPGRIVEVTPDKRTVWEYWNNYRTEEGQHWVFRAQKYDAAGTEWGERVESPFYAAACDL